MPQWPPRVTENLHLPQFTCLWQDSSRGIQASLGHTSTWDPRFPSVDSHLGGTRTLRVDSSFRATEKGQHLIHHHPHFRTECYSLIHLQPLAHTGPCWFPTTPHWFPNSWVIVLICKISWVLLLLPWDYRMLNSDTSMASMGSTELWVINPWW